MDGFKNGDMLQPLPGREAAIMRLRGVVEDAKVNGLNTATPALVVADIAELLEGGER